MLHVSRIVWTRAHGLDNGSYLRFDAPPTTPATARTSPLRHCAIERPSSVDTTALDGLTDSSQRTHARSDSIAAARSHAVESAAHALAQCGESTARVVSQRNGTVRSLLDDLLVRLALCSVLCYVPSLALERVSVRALEHSHTCVAQLSNSASRLPRLALVASAPLRQAPLDLASHARTPTPQSQSQVPDPLAATTPSAHAHARQQLAHSVVRSDFSPPITPARFTLTQVRCWHLRRASRLGSVRSRPACSCC